MTSHALNLFLRQQINPSNPIRAGTRVTHNPLLPTVWKIPSFKGKLGWARTRTDSPRKNRVVTRTQSNLAIVPIGGFTFNTRERIENKAGPNQEKLPSLKSRLSGLTAR